MRRARHTDRTAYRGVRPQDRNRGRPRHHDVTATDGGADAGRQQPVRAGDAHEAKQISERILARDRRRGLQKEALRTEPTTKGFVAAAMAAFGYVVGTGIKSGKKVKWDQRRRAARERLEHVAAAWDSATDQVLNAVRRSERGGRDGNTPS